jgi:hypothetical protein
VGYEVCEAANGKDALKVASEKAAVSLVLADWNTPEMNGLDPVKADSPDFSLPRSGLSFPYWPFLVARSLSAFASLRHS